MGKILSLLLIVSFLCMGVMNGVAANDVDDIDVSSRGHGPFYIGSKPFEEYEQPGFVCGFYTEIDWKPNANTSVRSLYSPHLLFGWDFGYRDPPIPLPWYFQIGAFASMVSFYQFSLSFVGIFTGTEPGFVCGFVDGDCHFSYP